MGAVRVLHLISSTGFYGAERWVLAAVRNFNPERVSSMLAVPEDSGQSMELYHRFLGLGHPVFRCPMRGRFDPGIIFQLRRIIRKEQINVIHTHGYKSDMIGLIAARVTGTLCVATPHGFDRYDKITEFYVRLSFPFLRRCDCVTPISEGLVEDMARIGVPSAKTRLILNGVDLTEIDAIKKGIESAGSASQSVRSIVHIGRLIERKNISALILAFDLLWRDRQDVRLLLVGEGPQEKMLRDLSNSLRCGPGVEFLGYRDDRLELLRRADVVAMTSQGEGIPRCLMEAMAMEVPIAAFDITGVDRLVLHERTGLLAPFGDAEALKNQFARILADPLLAQRLASNGRKHIDQNFSARRMAQEFTDLYFELLERKCRNLRAAAAQ
jgi:glycosyltransferase involved in cell wall biosynthesis